MDSNGGDDHATECSMGLSALWNSPCDGDLPTIDIDEHAWLSEDGGEGCAMNENRASLDSNGGDEHATECSMGLSALEALRNSPYDGDVPAIDIDEHAQDLGESTGKHNMTYKPTIF